MYWRLFCFCQLPLWGCKKTIPIAIESMYGILHNLGIWVRFFPFPVYWDNQYVSFIGGHPPFPVFLCKNGIFFPNHIGRTISAARQRQREDAAKLLSRAVRGVWGRPPLMKLPQDPSMYGILPLGSIYVWYIALRIHLCMVYFPTFRWILYGKWYR